MKEDTQLQRPLPRCDAQQPTLQQLVEHFRERTQPQQSAGITYEPLNGAQEPPQCVAAEPQPPVGSPKRPYARLFDTPAQSRPEMSFEQSGLSASEHLRLLREETNKHLLQAARDVIHRQFLFNRCVTGMTTSPSSSHQAASASGFLRVSADIAQPNGSIGSDLKLLADYYSSIPVPMDPTDVAAIIAARKAMLFNQFNPATMVPQQQPTMPQQHYGNGNTAQATAAATTPEAAGSVWFSSSSSDASSSQHRQQMHHDEPEQRRSSSPPGITEQVLNLSRSAQGKNPLVKLLTQNQCPMEPVVNRRKNLKPRALTPASVAASSPPSYRLEELSVDTKPALELQNARGFPPWKPKRHLQLEDIPGISEQIFENRELLERGLKLALVLPHMQQQQQTEKLTRDEIDGIFELLRSNDFPNRGTHVTLRNLWWSCCYQLFELTEGKKVNSVRECRLRQKYPPPYTIWDGEQTSYKFKVRA